MPRARLVDVFAPVRSAAFEAAGMADPQATGRAIRELQRARRRQREQPGVRFAAPAEAPECDDATYGTGVLVAKENSTDRMVVCGTNRNNEFAQLEPVYFSDNLVDGDAASGACQDGSGSGASTAKSVNLSLPDGVQYRCVVIGAASLEGAGEIRVSDPCASAWVRAGDTGTTSQEEQHTHGIPSEENHSHGIPTEGAHSHSIAGDASHQHDVRRGGNHEHGILAAPDHKHRDSRNILTTESGGHTHSGTTQVGGEHAHSMDAAGGHNHGTATGNAGGHNHGGTGAAGGHNHGGTNGGGAHSHTFQAGGGAVAQAVCTVTGATTARVEFQSVGGGSVTCRSASISIMCFRMGA